MMTNDEHARQHYDSARQELIMRLQLRDNALIGYLGVVGALGAAVLASPNHRMALLIVPYLSLGASFIVAQHQEIIGSIGSFIRHEYGSYLKYSGYNAPQWDDSISLDAYIDHALRLRLFAHIATLALPALVALTANVGLFANIAGFVIWVSSAGCAVCSIAVTFASHRWRHKVYGGHRSAEVATPISYQNEDVERPQPAVPTAMGALRPRRSDEVDSIEHSTRAAERR